MMLYMNQIDLDEAERLAINSTRTAVASAHAAEKRDVLMAYPEGWRPGDFIAAETQNTIEREKRTNPFKQQSKHTFEVAVSTVASVGDTFGRWHNQECMELKEVLLGMDPRKAGRVRFSDFYGVSSGKWHLVEPLGYLRQLGALDETSVSRGPQVLIPNYVLSLSNCAEPSVYYSVCCINECEEILSTLEEKIQSPEASAEEIAAVIQNVETSSMEYPMGNLTLQLQAQLEEVAEYHKGKVPLHGRLLAQWMHYAFPRECPFPHKSERLAPIGAAAWVELGNELPASPQEVASIREALIKDAQEAGYVAGGEEHNRELLEEDGNHKAAPRSRQYVEMSQWTLEEELFVETRMAPRFAASQDGPSFLTPAKGLGGLVLLGAILGVLKRGSSDLSSGP